MRNTRKLLCLLLALALVAACLPQMTVPARAAETSGWCGDLLTWEFDAAAGKLSIYGDDDMWDWAVDDPPWYSYAKDIQELYVEILITSLGAGAFRDCVNLTKTDISSSVTRIGDYAFDQCASLKSMASQYNLLEIGKGAFRGAGLTEVSFQSQLTDIGELAFADCTALKRVEFPKNVERIGADAFSGCTGLSRVTVFNQDCVIGAGAGTLGDPAKTVICGFAGSTAEAYAQQYGYSFQALPATSGKCGDGLTWSLDLTDGVLAISGTGDMTDWPNLNAVPWAEFRTAIRKITVGSGVASIGDYAFCECDRFYSIDLPGTVTRIGNYSFAECDNFNDVILPYSVTSIGEYAYANCDSLSGYITIPGGVKSIGKKAFANTRIDRISSIRILNKDCEIYDFEGTLNNPAKVTVSGFAGSTAEAFAANYGHKFELLPATSGQCGDDLTWSLDVTTGELQITGTGDMWAKKEWTPSVSGYAGLTTSITISEGVTSISDNAFEYYSRLQRVTLPDSLKRIGMMAFNECWALTDLTIPSGVTTIDYAAFSCCSLTGLTIPDGVTSISEMAFYNCRHLTEITIPAGVTSIGEYAFSDCDGLTEITIPNSVKSIGKQAFDDCAGLTEITIPNGVTSIGDGAFWGCKGLTSVTIPASVTSIGWYPFTDCASLQEIKIDSGNSSYCFEDGVLFTKDKTTLLGCLQTKTGGYQVPDGVEVIGEKAFENCEGLTSVSIPNSVHSIGPSAFYRCKGLESVTLPDGITQIGHETFYECESLKHVTIPQGVISIGREAFRGCTAMEHVSIPNSVKDIYGQAFYNCVGLKHIMIPYGVQHIMAGAFERCIGLTSVTIPNSVTEIDNWAFGECIGLESVTVLNNHCQYKDSRSTLGRPGFTTLRSFLSSSTTKTFADTYGYKYEILPSMSGACGDDLHYSVSVDPPELRISGTGDMWNWDNGDAPWYVYADGLPKVTVHSGVTGIGDGAFYGFRNLANLTLPSSINRIGDRAFEDCAGLTHLTLPGNVSSIGAEAFRGCTGLTDMTLPENVKTVGYRAFKDCAGLTSVTVLNKDCVINEDKNTLGDPETTTIRGYMGSTAHVYANKNGYKFEDVNSFRFEDVKNESAFYFVPVYWAYNATPQITNGLDHIYFGPNNGCTRGQVVTFLWRAAGCPAPASTETAFTDVGTKAFYTKAVAWAVEKGITKGMSETSFAPDTTCTRGQLVTFLWRFKNSPEPTVTDTGFTDVNETAFYAKAVAWAVEKGITKGMTPTTFAPNDTCTRGQIVTFLYRAMNG